MRVLIAAAALAFAAPAFAQDSENAPSDGWSGHFVDQYRFGGTYDVIKAGDAGACEAVCTNSDGCKAWSYATASLASDSYCELKHIVGTAEYRPGTISGVSAAIFDPAVRRFSGAPDVPTAAPVEAVETASVEAPVEDIDMVVETISAEAPVEALKVTPVEAPETVETVAAEAPAEELEPVAVEGFAEKTPTPPSEKATSGPTVLTGAASIAR